MSSAPRYIPHYTIDDYQHWEGDWELIDGVPIAMTPSPFGPHERVVTRLSFQFQSQIEKLGCDCVVYTNLDWIVANDTVIRPDLMIVCGEQPMRHLEHPPAAIIEVLSDSTRDTDLNAKRSIAQESGLKTYLVVDPDERSIHEISGETIIDKSVTNQFDVVLSDKCRVEIDIRRLFDAP